MRKYKKITHLVNTDENLFLKALDETLVDFTNKEYDIEVQYSTSCNNHYIVYSALIIGYEVTE